MPFVRHVCRFSLQELNVAPWVVSDIEIAVSEACTNVLRHAMGPNDEFEVHVSVNDLDCQISVKDAGAFDTGMIDGGDPSLTAESGRGIFLMKALVDKLDFVSDPSSGTTVHLRKSLERLPDGLSGHAAGAADAPILE